MIHVLLCVLSFNAVTCHWQYACREAQLELGANAECLQSLSNATVGDEVLCSHANMPHIDKQLLSTLCRG